MLAAPIFADQGVQPSPIILRITRHVGACTCRAALSCLVGSGSAVPARMRTVRQSTIWHHILPRFSPTRQYPVIDLRVTIPLLLALTVGFGVFVALARVDDVAGAARLADDRGLNRGPILDQHGRPLAWTVNARGTARRLYTLPSLQTSLGYRDPFGSWHGLENRYGAFLDSAETKHDWRSFFLHLEGRSVASGKVRLTIDSTVQSAADRALGNSKGAIVVIDPRTGGVLALVSKPDCSPEALSHLSTYHACLRDHNRPLMDRALQLLLPPGSAFKIVTLSAAMDTGAYRLDSLFSGADAFGPSPYFDNAAYPSNVTRADLTQLTLLQALAFSDNFSFARIGLTLGARVLLKYAHRYWVGRRIPFEYLVAISSIADNRAYPTLSELAQSAFGAEVDRVTPMQMALIAATAANRGVMMAPHLVQDTEDQTGHIIRRYRVHPLGRVMSARAARDVTTGMVFVVDHGSGYRAQIGGIGVAGKTGTAASGGNRPHAWFIAFAPARHPVVALAVLRQYSGEGFKFAAPIARKILVAALRQRGYRVR